MEPPITKIDFKPKPGSEPLPRGVNALREYQVFDHERQTWVGYTEYTYHASIGVAHICLARGHSLKVGMEAALKLLQDDRNPSLSGPGYYGVCNSLKNHEDLLSSTPLSLVIARSGAHTERSVGKVLNVFTGNGQIQPSRLHRLMADRPALVFPYQPFSDTSYERLKPAFVPPEVKMKYATPFGTEKNELLLAGKVVNRWSSSFYDKVLKDTDYTLWITEGEKKAMCLAMLPLLLGLKADVIGIPGVWMWGKKQSDGTRKLVPELAAYTFASEGRRRLVGIVFDADAWRNPKVADALLRLCICLRGAGAMVFIGVIPQGINQKGIDDYFVKHCFTEEGFDFQPLLTLLGKAVYVDREFTVNYPPPEVDCKLRTLVDKAEEFEELREDCRGLRFSDLDEAQVNDVVSSIGMFLDPESSELNGGQSLSHFRAQTPEAQALQWQHWLESNPFQAELDRILDRYIPGVFRGRSAQDPAVTFQQVHRDKLSPEQLKDLNYF
jgi:Domain of unknown function (DUF3854)